MTKLTDAHRTILAAAGARETYLVLPLPKSLKLTADKGRPILTKLLKAGLLAERAATEGEPTWRRDETSDAITLIISDAGLTEVGIEPREGTVEAPKTRSPRSTRGNQSATTNCSHSNW
jgi:hypothetical protein